MNTRNAANLLSTLSAMLFLAGCRQTAPTPSASASARAGTSNRENAQELEFERNLNNANRVSKDVQKWLTEAELKNLGKSPNQNSITVAAYVTANTDDLIGLKSQKPAAYGALVQKMAAAIKSGKPADATAFALTPQMENSPFFQQILAQRQQTQKAVDMIWKKAHPNPQ